MEKAAIKTKAGCILQGKCIFVPPPLVVEKIIDVPQLKFVEKILEIEKVAEIEVDKIVEVPVVTVVEVEKIVVKCVVAPPAVNVECQAKESIIRAECILSAPLAAHRDEIQKKIDEHKGRHPGGTRPGCESSRSTWNVFSIVSTRLSVRRCVASLVGTIHRHDRAHRCKSSSQRCGPGSHSVYGKGGGLYCRGAIQPIRASMQCCRHESK